MRRRRWIGGVVLGVVVLLVAVLIVGDVVARAQVQKRLATHVRTATGAQSVSVHIGSFPFLYEVLVSKISSVDVVAEGVPVDGLRLNQVTVDAHQVKLDRHVLLVNRKVKVDSVAKATVTVLVKTSGLTSALAAVDAKVSLVDGHYLVVTALGHQVLSVDLTTNKLVPDCDFVLTQLADGYRLSCTVSPVPASLLTALSRAD